MLCGIRWIKEKRHTHTHRPRYKQMNGTKKQIRWREYKQQYHMNDIIVYGEETLSQQTIMSVFSVKHEFQSTRDLAIYFYRSSFSFSVLCNCTDWTAIRCNYTRLISLVVTLIKIIDFLFNAVAVAPFFRGHSLWCFDYSSSIELTHR